MLHWSLIFIFAFLIVSIQSSEKALPLNFFVATNSFEYMEIGADGKEVPKNRDDKILMVGTDFGKIVGSAQSYCRHINPPAEQTILIKPSELKHYPFEDLTINKTKQLLPIEDWECAAPHYGFFL
uniref:Sema domain-containing protein n=1 Tax=Panagrolaimus superbus TaxID=310955 RepID=A0A914YBX2_9BILA